MIRIADDVQTVLTESRFEDGVLRLPPKLERGLYTRTNKVLEALGGKWNRKAGGHVFASDPRSQLQEGLERGSVTSLQEDLQFFPTPEPVIDLMLERARLAPGMVVLEPSAGRGAIASRLFRLGCVVDVCEQHAPFRSELSSCGLDFRLLPETDFLEVDRFYSRIVANPPFSKCADVDHVNHMLNLLQPGGVLVSVMAAGVIYRNDRKTAALRQRLERETVHQFEPLPERSFRESGTDVQTVLLTATKRRGA